MTEECDVTIRNMTPTIITAYLILTLLTPNQALFFGIRNARQRNDMYLKSELTSVHDFVQVLHDDGDDPEQVHLGLGLVRVDALVRIVSSGKTGKII